MSIHIIFYTDEPVILTDDFSELEKEIDTFDLPPDLSIPENAMSDYHHKWSESRTYDFNDICAMSTVAYYKCGNPFEDIVDCLQVSIPDILLVGATGLIDPFWTLFVKRIKFKFEHFNQYIELPLIESGITLQQVMSDPIAMSKKIGNRIIIATDRKGKAVIKTIYDDCKKFEEYLEQEAKILEEFLSSPPKKKKTTTVQMTTTPVTQSKPQQQPKPKQSDEIHHYACNIDIDYWDTIFNLPSEEQAYYGWEHDPQ